MAVYAVAPILVGDDGHVVAFVYYAGVGDALACLLVGDGACDELGCCGYIPKGQADERQKHRDSEWFSCHYDCILAFIWKCRAKLQQSYIMLVSCYELLAFFNGVRLPRMSAVRSW